MKICSKNNLSLLFFILFSLSFTAFLHAEAFRSPSIGGATGLIITPTSHTGWEGSRFGFDVAAHYIDNSDNVGSDEGYMVYKALLGLGVSGTNLEIGFTYDDQPDYDAYHNKDTDDMMLNAKWEFTEGLAVGCNFQMMQVNTTGNDRNDFQLYLAATYPGNFFSMPAETTLVVGHTFWGKDAGDNENKNIDFSMGFDLDLAPSIFKNYVHWINDFSNYSYSTEGGGATDVGGAISLSRGVFNTGFRIAFLRDKKYKLNLDVIMTDALDENRDWAIGAAFGMSL